MILEFILLSSALGAGYTVLKKQDAVFEKRSLQEQKRQTSALQARMRGEKEPDPNDSERSSVAKVLSGVGAPVATSRRALSRSPRDLALVGVALTAATAGTLFFPPLTMVVPPLLIYAGRKRFIIAGSQLRRGRIGVELIASLSTIGALLAQQYIIACVLMLVNGVGDYLSTKVIKDSKHDLIDLFDGIPKSVWLLKDGVEIATPLDEVRRGDVLVVNAGGMIPADGRIVWGAAGVDEHRFTGEAAPVEKGVGDEVFAMTLALSGKIHFEVEKAGAETSASQIADILNHTADYKSNTVLEAQALSQKLVAPTLVSSACVLPVFGFSSAVGMFFAHPKERLQITAPISLLTYLRHAMKEGILIKDGRSLELLSKVDTLVFDKTGTLTEEVPRIGEIHCFDQDHDDKAVLAYAAMAEYRQTHPLAQAILDAAAERCPPLREPDHSEYRLGYGVRVTCDAETILIGSARFMQSEGVGLSDGVEDIMSRCEAEGHGLVLVALDGRLIGAVELAPSPRPEASATIAALKRLPNITETCILSGDREAPTSKLAAELGVDRYFAQVLPEQKAAMVESLQQQGRFVCFIGDGVNDAIAMKQAQVSISLQGASQLATDTAQIVLLDKGISHLPHLFELAKGFKRHMRRQFGLVLAPSLFGAGMIILSGWGMVYVMYMNMATLAVTLSNALLERPAPPQNPPTE